MTTSGGIVDHEEAKKKPRIFPPKCFFLASSWSMIPPDVVITTNPNCLEGRSLEVHPSICLILTSNLGEMTAPTGRDPESTNLSFLITSHFPSFSKADRLTSNRPTSTEVEYMVKNRCPSGFKILRSSVMLVGLIVWEDIPHDVTITS